jgi:hypothetical protein
MRDSIALLKNSIVFKKRPSFENHVKAAGKRFLLIG